MAFNIMDEAERCLQCRNPQCKKGCPIGTDIPKAIRLLKESRVNEAGEMLYRNNPLTTVCSLICNHENQCEGHCVLGRKGAPVHFSAIEHYISETYAYQMNGRKEPLTGARVAVIGSGPAGLTVAIILSGYGYQVTIFESKDRIGGMLRYGIPEYRLPKAVLDDLERRSITMQGIQVRPNTTVGQAVTIDDLFRDGYEAVFVGTGVWRPGVLHIPGETLGNVHFGINYLSNPEVYELGNSVIVIGAGNTAVDVARTSIRHGARNVTSYARSDRVAASAYEVQYAKLEGVNFESFERPVEIIREGCIFVKTVRREDGRIVDLPDSEHLVPADSVIVAIGQGPMSRLVRTTEGLQANDRGLLWADEQGFTSREGVFSAGDVVEGARTVVEAVAHSKIVAESMRRYLEEKENGGKKTGSAS